MLVIKAKTGPFKGSWALPGGLVRPFESIEESVCKRLSQYVRLNNFYMEQLFTFGALNRDPSGRIVSVSYLVLMPQISIKHADDAQWIPVRKLPKLAYDHNQIIKLALKRLKDKLNYTNICFALMPDIFTFSELQDRYETILGHSLDKRNFRKKILSAKLIRFIGKMKKGEPNRPARLYRFSDNKIKNVDIL